MAVEFGPRVAIRASQFGCDLSQSELAQLEAYFNLLNRWNSRINLTALHLRPLSDHALDRLLVEPLIAAQHIADSAITWFDLGSGGGSPAIPLKILRPRLRLTMVESVGKKAAFLREAVRTLSLLDADVENSRFEHMATLGHCQNTAELITARAIRGNTLLRAATRLLSPTGALWIFRSAASPQSHSALFRGVVTVPLVGQAVLDVCRR